MLQRLDERNQKIIDAVIAKANQVCPGSLALIGIYGSFMSGDIHEKSDLDLLILINDDMGWQLGCAFIQDDLQVGHDIYCTGWESLERDADYEHPNISKLMDSKIVYCVDEKYIERLEELRRKVQEKLNVSFSKDDYDKAEKLLKEAEHFYTRAMVTDVLPDTWAQVGNVLYYIENAIAMLNKKYFRYGTKRVYEELAQMEWRPENLCELIEEVVSANSVELIKQHLTVLMKEVIRVFDDVGKSEFNEKKPVTADAVCGTYEEMFSNWRNKMYLAAKEDNRHLAFLSMSSLNEMISDIGTEVAIDHYNVLGFYDSQNLQKTAEAYDEVLKNYLKEYEKINIQARHYSDIEEFVEAYLYEK